MTTGEARNSTFGWLPALVSVWVAAGLITPFPAVARRKGSGVENHDHMGGRKQHGHNTAHTQRISSRTALEKEILAKLDSAAIGGSPQVKKKAQAIIKNSRQLPNHLQLDVLSELLHQIHQEGLSVRLEAYLNEKFPGMILESQSGWFPHWLSGFEMRVNGEYIPRHKKTKEIVGGLPSSTGKRVLNVAMEKTKKLGIGWDERGWLYTSRFLSDHKHEYSDEEALVNALGKKMEEYYHTELSW